MSKSNMTQSNPWVKFSEQKPTKEDANNYGFVLYKFDNDSFGLFNWSESLTSYLPTIWTTIPNFPEQTRDDLDLAEFNRFKDTYSLHSSMVNSLNLKLAYEVGLREARKQAREAFEKIEIEIEVSDGNEEAAQAFVASIAE